MSGEELDKALHECMGVIWKSYRESVKSGNFKPFNDCFHGLYEKYDDSSVHEFIGRMGLALSPAAYKRIRGEKSNG